MTKRITIIGGGAAGFFAAIRCKELHRHAEVVILEKQQKVLSKVKISGGGRCNVTHACFVPEDLVNFYPRGKKELLAPFKQFNPTHTVAWFKERGVKLKTEADGRMFPTTDNSQTIVDCLYLNALNLGVKLHLGEGLKSIVPREKGGFTLATDARTFATDALIMAAGSSPQIWGILQQIGHTIMKPVPSLFTFKCKDTRIEGLAGVAMSDVQVSVLDTKLAERGAFLVTHQGLSAPAILRLSAWGARVLHDLNYRFTLKINFVPAFTPEKMRLQLSEQKTLLAKKHVHAHALFDVPQRLWRSLATAAGIPEALTWADCPKQLLFKLTEQLTEAHVAIDGKNTFKDEFVTAGGVQLKEVNFKTMESKLLPHLFFAGEVLDIDAVTGGFNFQAAWTTAWIAASSV